MAQVREAFNPSSPHSSSGGADSYKHDGTPDTRLTAFSPDDALTRSGKTIQSLNIGVATEHTPVRFPGQPSKLYRGSSIPPEKDPFITGGTKPDRKLSATASAFQPISGPVVGYGTAHGVDRVRANSASAQRCISQDSVVLDSSNQISRYLIITATAGNDSVDVKDVEKYLAELERQGSAARGRCNIFAGVTDTYVQFNNIRDACDAYACLQIDKPEWSASYLSSNDFNRAIKHDYEPSRIGDIGEGQVHVIAQLPLGWDLLRAEDALSQAFSLKGEVLAFQRQNDSNAFQLRAVVEFADIEVANSVVASFNGANLNGIRLFVSTLKPNDMMPSADRAGRIMSPPQSVPLQDISSLVQNMSLAKNPQAIMTPGRHTSTPAAIQVYPQMSMYPMVYNGQFSSGAHYVVEPLPTRAQPTTPLTSSVGILTPLYTTPASTPLVAIRDDFHSPRSMQSFGGNDGRRQNAVRVNRSSYYNAASHHNHVDVNRIREGIDVRTTIMLRNIPNKVDQAMLKRIIDESSWGKYDFMYLRIDFANECNVGYAFINFVDPLDIIDFVNARGNQRWNCFKSDKVAEISYATIQGKDCLVQKFRNSSVMLEAAHYRPKLFYTSNGPQPEKAGQEEPFPDPDNHSKMKRSCENAEHVGLFTPNAGQHFRDEQRRRRSQYDRGTRLAALEEYDYENHLMRDQGIYPSQ